MIGLVLWSTMARLYVMIDNFNYFGTLKRAKMVKHKYEQVLDMIKLG